MDLWVWWLIAGVAFAVGEMAIMGFFLAPFAGGSFAAALFALAGAGTAVSVVVFVVITALLFLFVRPVARLQAGQQDGGAGRHARAEDRRGRRVVEPGDRRLVESQRRVTVARVAVGGRVRVIAR